MLPEGVQKGAPAGAAWFGGGQADVRPVEATDGNAHRGGAKRVGKAAFSWAVAYRRDVRGDGYRRAISDG